MADIEGIIPAAGLGSRLSPLPCSKEVLPVFSESESPDAGKIKVISEHLIENMKNAGIENIHIVVRSGKWDIPGYYLSGNKQKVNICYHVAENLSGPPFTLDTAYPFLKNKNLLLGFPDIFIQPPNTLRKLRFEFEKDDDSDVLLGLFPQTEYLKWDMVALDDMKHISDIVIKNESAKSLKYGWFAAIWKPGFTDFMHKYLQEYEQKAEKNCIESELQIGNLFKVALKRGFSVKGIIFNQVKCLDAGTFEGIKKIHDF